MTKNEILELAIKTYGVNSQENMAIEEMAELTQAINKKHRGKAHNIAEEIADVEICLEQLKIINNCKNDVDLIKIKKIDRLMDRLCDRLCDKHF